MLPHATQIFEWSCRACLRLTEQAADDGNQVGWAGVCVWRQKKSVLFNKAAPESTIKSNSIAHHFIQEVLHVMSGGQCMMTQMRTWLTCLLSHSVVQSKPSLFVRYYRKYFLRRKSRGYGRRLSAFLLPPRIGTTFPFLYNFNTHSVLLRVQVEVEDFCLLVTERVGARLLFYLVFNFILILNLAFMVMILQSKVVYPEWLNPSLVWGECFSSLCVY